MNKNISIAMIIFGGFAYLSNPSIGFLIIIFGLITLLANKFAGKEEKKEEKNYKIEEGFVIESTKQLPYKIPSTLELKYKPGEKQEKPKWTKATSKGLVPLLAKKFTDLLKKI